MLTDQMLLFSYGSSNAATTPLDGLSNLTGAWSFSRKLLSAYGGSFATASTNTTLFNQEGTTLRDLVQTGVSPTGRAPALSTAGPNSRACGDFDGTDDCLVGQSAAALGNLGSNSSLYIIISGIFDTLTLDNNTNKDRNHRIMIDTADDIGIMGRLGGILYGYNFDTNADFAASSSGAITAGTPYVLEWYHSGGNVGLSINGGTDITTASGNTSSVLGLLAIGGLTSGTGPFDGKIFELAAFSVLPNSTIRGNLVTDMRNWIGA